jgi:hypothetical protein
VLEHAARVVGDRRVQPGRAERALGPVRPDTSRAAGAPRISVAIATGRWSSIASITLPSSGNSPVSIGSTSTSMMPPQVSPTAIASSSLTPYLTSCGSPASINLLGSS